MTRYYLPKHIDMKDFVDKLVEWFPKLADDRFRMLYPVFYEKWKYNREAEVSYRFWVWLACSSELEEWYDAGNHYRMGKRDKHDATGVAHVTPLPANNHLP